MTWIHNAYWSGKALLSGALANSNLTEESIICVQHCDGGGREVCVWVGGGIKKCLERNLCISAQMKKMSNRLWLNIQKNSEPVVFRTSLPGDWFRVDIQPGKARDLVLCQCRWIAFLNAQFLWLQHTITSSGKWITIQKKIIIMWYCYKVVSILCQLFKKREGLKKKKTFL